MDYFFLSVVLGVSSSLVPNNCLQRKRCICSKLVQTYLSTIKELKPSFTDAIRVRRALTAVEELDRKVINSWPTTFNLCSQSSSAIQGADLIVLGKTPSAYFILSFQIVQNTATRRSVNTSTDTSLEHCGCISHV